MMVVIVAMVLGLLVVPYLAWVLGQWYASKLCEAELVKLSELLPVPGEYSYYTDGHPYVWVSTNYEEILKKLHQCCFYTYGQAVSERYSIKVVEQTKRVYFVARYGDFDFDSLMHYDEWLASSQEVAEKIAKHKNYT